jgi:alkylhydroperoxidase family enzyme
VRLEPVPRDQLDPELRATLDTFIKGAPEFNPLVFQTMGHNPEVSKAFYHFYIPIRTESRLDVKLKELVRLKIAQLNDCST